MTVVWLITECVPSGDYINYLVFRSTASRVDELSLELKLLESVLQAF